LHSPFEPAPAHNTVPTNKKKSAAPVFIVVAVAAVVALLALSAPIWVAWIVIGLGL
jgi:hypothetical protein